MSQRLRERFDGNLMERFRQSLVEHGGLDVVGIRHAWSSVGGRIVGWVLLHVEVEFFVEVGGEGLVLFCEEREGKVALQGRTRSGYQLGVRARVEEEEFV